MCSKSHSILYENISYDKPPVCSNLTFMEYFIQDQCKYITEEFYCIAAMLIKAQRATASDARIYVPAKE